MFGGYDIQWYFGLLKGGVGFARRISVLPKSQYIVLLSLILILEA